MSGRVKSEYQNPKQIRISKFKILNEEGMTQRQAAKQYDLEERTFRFAQRVRGFVKKLPKSVANTDDSR